MGDILGVNPRKPLGYSNHLGVEGHLEEHL